ncbi:exported protein of unknown function, might belong to Permease [Moritella yayanosii]|uniref:EamA domain-containing protein n=2 Tax=Moritella yayanosii TaxID=69539 RepID=A0A330LQN3_9GAMM|nr:exported protein of unknown function, might belong to Permease [Moritella yayanosii]
MFYQTLLTACMLSPFLSVDLAEINNDNWTLLVVLGICFTAMPHTLLVTALRYLKAKTVGLTTCLQPLYGSLLAIHFLGEIPNAATITVAYSWSQPPSLKHGMQEKNRSINAV